MTTTPGRTRLALCTPLLDVAWCMAFVAVLIASEVNAQKALLPAQEHLRPLVPKWSLVLDSLQVDTGPRWWAGVVTSVEHVAGSVVVTDERNNQLLIVDALTGKPRTVVGSLGQGPQQLHEPSGTAVVGSRLAVLDKRNNRLSLYETGSFQSLGLSVPTPEDSWIIRSAPGTAYVFTRGFGSFLSELWRVPCCTPNAATPQKVDLRPGLARHAIGFVATSDALVFAHANHLQVYDRSGRLLHTITFEQRPDGADPIGRTGESLRFKLDPSS
jgi:hypothetical protein